MKDEKLKKWLFSKSLTPYAKALDEIVSVITFKTEKEAVEFLAILDLDSRRHLIKVILAKVINQMVIDLTVNPSQELIKKALE